MFALATIRIARYTAALTQVIKLICTARQDLMDIRLMTGIKKKNIFWRFKDAMQSNGEFYDA